MDNIIDPLFVQEEIPLPEQVVRRLKIESVTGFSFGNDESVQSPGGFRSHLARYDRGGNKLGQQQYNREGQTIHEWVYDSAGRLSREIDYDTSGRINFRLEYLYGESGQLNEKRMYLSGRSLHYRIIMNRDIQGRVIEAIYYDASGEKIQTDSYVYDSLGRLAGVSVGHTAEWVYEYDEHDNLRRKTGDLPSASAFGETFEFQYDNRGLLVQRIHLHHSATVFEYTLFT